MIALQPRHEPRKQGREVYLGGAAGLPSGKTEFQVIAQVREGECQPTGPESDDESEIWFPIRSELKRSKPFAEVTFDYAFWAAVDINPSLLAEQRQAIVAILQKYPALFPARGSMS